MSVSLSPLRAIRRILALDDFDPLRLLVLYGVNAVGLLVVAASALVVVGDPGSNWPLIGAGTVIALVVSAFPLRLPHGSMYAPIFWPTMLVLILNSPSAGVLVAFLGSTEWRELNGKVPWYGALFNHASIAISAAISGSVFAIFAPPDVYHVAALLACIATGVTFVVTHVPFPAAAYWIRGLDPMNTLHGDTIRSSSLSALLAPLSWISALLVVHPGLWAVSGMAVPVFLATIGWNQLVAARRLRQVIGETEQMARAVVGGSADLLADVSPAAVERFLEHICPSHGSAMILLSDAGSSIYAQSGVDLSPQLRRWLAELPADIDDNGVEWLSQISTHEGVYPNVASGLGAALAMAVQVETHQRWGLLVLVTRQADREWLPIERNALATAANVIGSALQSDLARQALQASERRRTQVLETLAEAVLFVTRDGHLQPWNAAARQLVPDEVLRRGTAAALDEQLYSEHGASAGGSGGVIAEVCRTGLAQSSEVRFGTASSEQRWLINAQPIRDHDAGPYAVVLSISDISARREMEERLRTGQRLEAVGRLAGGVAHDFNNVLGALIGYAGLALDTLGDEPARQDIEQLLTVAQRGRALTDQLLSFSRGRAQIDLDVLDLNAMVHAARPLLRGIRVAHSAAHPIDFALSADTLLVRADAAQLDQVLSNLATNALEAVPEGGNVRVSTDLRDIIGDLELPDGRYASLQVVDDGIGMDPQTLRQLWEPFFTTKNGGTGLGLSTSYGIVRQLGGIIRVESELGRGSRFEVLLPIAEEGPAQPRPHPDDYAERPTTSIKVLIVDDEKSVLDVAARMLRRAGYQVVTSPDPRQAEEIFLAVGDIDVLLTDVVMPQLDGRQLAAQLRTHDRRLRVLLMSGYIDPGDTDVGMIADGFVPKPFSAEELRKAVETVLLGHPRS